jgi:tRNA pseudouridine55 synthase
MVYRLELLRYAPPLVELSMEVGRGAYVRSLAHDLGERLGCHAHVVRLTRTASGPFVLDEAIAPEELERAAAAGSWQELLCAPDRVLEAWQAAILGEDHTREVGQGRLVVLEARPEAGEPLPDTPCRAYSDSGDFLAVLRHRGSGRWQPEKVFAAL